MRTLAALALATAFTFAGSGIALAGEEKPTCTADGINVLTCVHVQDVDDLVDISDVADTSDVVELDLDDVLED